MEYRFRNFFDMQHFVGRVCKNKIILRFANRQKMKNIIADHADLAKPKFAGSGADKANMALVYFHGMNIAASTRSKLVTDASGARKQVKYLKRRHVVTIGKDIE
jgi:hypothetical protein